MLPVATGERTAVISCSLPEATQRPSNLSLHRHWSAPPAAPPGSMGDIYTAYCVLRVYSPVSHHGYYLYYLYYLYYVYYLLHIYRRFCAISSRDRCRDEVNSVRVTDL